MKKTFILLVAAASAIVGCQKNAPVVQNEPKGVPMSIDVSLGGSKATYALDGSVMKSTWDASETISVITLNGTTNNAEMVAIDNFTSTGAAGRDVATFSGTFTGGATPKRVMVIYPALEEYETGIYGTPIYYGTHRNFYGVTTGTIYAESCLDYIYQSADNSTEHLRNYFIMSGYADLEKIGTGVLSATLSHQMSLLRVNLTFDDSAKGLPIQNLYVDSFKSDDSQNSVFRPSGSWEYLNICHSPINGSGAGPNYRISMTCNFNVPASGTATLYLPFIPAADCSAGDYWNVNVSINSSTKTIKKTFTSDKSLQRGYMYTVDAAVPAM